MRAIITAEVVCRVSDDTTDEELEAIAAEVGAHAYDSMLGNGSDVTVVVSFSTGRPSESSSVEYRGGRVV